MAIHRYWRLTGFATLGNTALELSEARIYEGGVVADAAATLTATIAPASGAVTDLRDGVASAVVSWPYAIYSAPSFALVWDFGAGLGVDQAQLRLGSGSTQANFALDLTLQSSDDGALWANFGSRESITWPGAMALTAVPDLGDPHFSNVLIYLRSIGIDGTYFKDESNYARSIAIAGTPKVSAAQSAFGDSSILFNLANYDQTQALYLASGIGDFAFPGDFTIKCRLFPIAFGATWGSFILSTINAAFTPLSGFYLTYGNANAPAYNKIQFGYGSVGIQSDAAPVLNEWSDIMITRVDGVVRMFVRGVLQTETATDSSSISASMWLMGRSSNNASTTGIRGYVDEIIITQGVGRQSASFTPLTTRAPKALNSPPVTPALRLSSTAPGTESMLPAVALPDSTAQGHVREVSFFDAQFGGTGTITDTVTKKALPDNTPLHRRVLLMDQRSQVVFRETWSDAATGAYAFPGVKTGVPYTVVAYDHTGLYRAVIADNIIATP